MTKGGKRTTRPKQSSQQAANLVGQLVRFRLARAAPGFWVAGVVIDVRHRYSYWDLHIVPIVGSGSVWVNLNNVEPSGDYNQVLSDEGARALQGRVDELCGSATEDN